MVGSPLKEVVANINNIFKQTYYVRGTVDELVIQHTIKDMGHQYRKWDLWYNGGTREIPTDFGYKEVIEEGFKNRFRRTICQSKELITNDELIDYFANYTEDFSLLDNSETRLPEVKRIKRSINEIFGKSLKDRNYDEELKQWKDFDVTGAFMRTRGMMIDKKYPIPQYVWNLIAGNPFDRVYRNCRDYMKWKGTKKVAKLVFNNVCMWENGQIFRKGEPDKEFEYPLWINWNMVGKDFLSMKTKLKKEDDGLQFLKVEVCDYIKSKVTFYEKFGENSKYFIADELLNEFDNLI